MTFSESLKLMNRSGLPNSASKLLGLLLDLFENAPESFWLRQQSLADYLECSKSTVGRNLRRLIDAGFLIDLGQKHEKRYKMYRLPPQIATSVPLHPVEKKPIIRDKEGIPEASREFWDLHIGRIKSQYNLNGGHVHRMFNDVLPTLKVDTPEEVIEALELYWRKRGPVPPDLF